MAAATDVDAVFETALAADAGRDTPADVPAPERTDRDPEAPFGRAEDGSPVAPHGLKADGTPRLHPAGPGRGNKKDAPRVTTSPAKPEQPRDGTDYTDDLMGLGMAVWIGASSLKGGRLLGIPLPDLRPYAMAWKAQLPQQAAAWNAAAKQNATVRGYVQKFTGDGSMTWMIGVAVAAAGLAAGMAEIARADAGLKATLAEANDRHMKAFTEQQIASAGLGEAA